MAKAPLAELKETFQTRDKLIAQLLPLFTKKDASKARLGRLSNKRLLRLYRVEQKVREKFGDRDKLEAFLLERAKKAGHAHGDAFQATLKAASKAQLLDWTHWRIGAPAAGAALQPGAVPKTKTAAAVAARAKKPAAAKKPATKRASTS